VHPYPTPCCRYTVHPTTTSTLSPDSCAMCKAAEIAKLKSEVKKMQEQQRVQRLKRQVSCSFTVNSRPYALRPTPYALHSAPCTPQAVGRLHLNPN